MINFKQQISLFGVSRSALNNLVNEHADLSWDMAIRLSKAFGSTPEGWMRVQFQYDAAHVEERAKKIKVKPVKMELVQGELSFRQFFETEADLSRDRIEVTPGRRSGKRWGTLWVVWLSTFPPHILYLPLDR